MIYHVLSGFFLFALLITIPTPAKAETITIATASNFLQTLKKLQVPFAKKSGDKLTIITGASGALTNQIIHGAPFDVFLSADQKHPQLLVKKGFAIPASLITYAYGRLILWSPDDKLFDPINAVAVLKAGKISSIAIANPALAPYGLAAIQTLRSLNLYSRLSSKIVHGNNIAQTFTMLATGAAPIGFVARSQTTQPPWNTTGSHWLVPDLLYQPIRQTGVIVKASPHQPAAKRFMAFLQSSQAKWIIKLSGYGTE